MPTRIQIRYDDMEVKVNSGGFRNSERGVQPLAREGDSLCSPILRAEVT